MHDSLLGRMHVKETHAKFGAVLTKGFYLRGSNWISDTYSARISRDVMVYGSNCELRTAHSPSIELQSLKCLWRGYFMHQVQVDIQQRRLASLFSDDMRIPDFFE